MIRRLWQGFWTPSAKYAWGAIFVVGGVAGIIFWGGFNTFMEATNTLEFCTSCHEMEQGVSQEYKETVHFQNRTGVRATCSDCHVPDPWIYKVVRKVRATNELYHWALGTIDDMDKFENKRLTLAKNVWKSMKETDSRECRNCHSWEAMLSDKQKRRAVKQHKNAREEGATCIDCHKGVAHRPVHKLLAEDDDPYDGKPDSRRLPSKEEEAAAKAAAEAKRKAAEEAARKAAEEAAAKKSAEEAAAKEAAATEQAAAASGGASADGGIDWSNVAGTDVVLLYPGQASLEWVLKGSDHGGGRAVRRIGDPCRECHKGEEADMGQRIVTGEKAESTPIPGKRGSIKVNVKGVHDGDTMTLRFEWPDAGHTPAPFVSGGKMDPENQIKLAIMFDDGKVDMGEQSGCWQTCHHDSRYMPDHPKPEALAQAGDIGKIIDLSGGVTKYTKGSREKIDYKGRDGKPRGGWDKLLSKEDLDTKLAEGAFMDLIRYMSGGGGKVESGYILGQRVLAPTKKVSGVGMQRRGVWSVVLKRPLKATRPGGVSIEPGNLYTVGVAIHDDFTSARFHHVSLEYKLGLDNPEAEINVVKK